MSKHLSRKLARQNRFAIGRTCPVDQIIRLLVVDEDYSLYGHGLSDTYLCGEHHGLAVPIFHMAPALYASYRATANRLLATCP